MTTASEQKSLFNGEPLGAGMDTINICCQHRFFEVVRRNVGMNVRMSAIMNEAMQRCFVVIMSLYVFAGAGCMYAGNADGMDGPVGESVMADADDNQDVNKALESSKELLDSDVGMQCADLLTELCYEHTEIFQSGVLRPMREEQFHAVLNKESPQCKSILLKGFRRYEDQVPKDQWSFIACMRIFL